MLFTQAKMQEVLDAVAEVFDFQEDLLCVILISNGVENSYIANCPREIVKAMIGVYQERLQQTTFNA